MRLLLTFEPLNLRLLLTGDLELAHFADAETNPGPHAAEVTPQYAVKHPPRIQPGNAALVGTPAFDGFDQIDLIWQTISAGDGTEDSFAVEYRKVGNQEWHATESLNELIDTNIGRIMHSVTIRGLEWSTDYRYRVHHLRAGEIIETYENQFRTRLRAGDQSGFSFAAYGDSTNRGEIEDFNSVQAQINRQNLDFAVLLGDNFYPFGTHHDADGRFDPEYSPEATAWTSRKVDYFAIGNHDLFAENGKPSRELFSVPIPEVGVTSPVGLPDGEFAEHSYSFDFGAVHFVTFDTNPVEFSNGIERQLRLDALIDYAVADLEASDAKWKIVYGHHPFIGTEKRQMPNDFYYQQMVSKLNEAGADLVMVSHSHSYSWTYPLTGFSDANMDGQISIDEVSFIRDEDQVYQKGSGIIQLVSGVGGGSLRHTTYDEPFFANGFSMAESTGPLDHGFAKVDVTPSSLVVSYISAESGLIVGDSNGNGQRDADEVFGQFKIIDPTVANPDFNVDGQVDSLDIDLLARAIRDKLEQSSFDLNQDQRVDADDVDFLLKSYLRTAPGDANLDGIFDSRDLVMVFQTAQFEDSVSLNSGWRDGDWNGDGEFTSGDLVLAFQTGEYGK